MRVTRSHTAWLTFLSVPVWLASCGDYGSEPEKGPVAAVDGGGDEQRATSGVGNDGAPPVGAVVNDDYQPGTRLQPNFVTVGDQRQFIDWWDSELGLHCTFRRLKNDELRCVPVAPKGTDTTGASLFTDSACTSVALQLYSCPKKPEFADVGTCETGLDIRRVGAAAGESLYKRGGSTGACTPDVTGVGVYALGAAVPSSALVLGTLEDGPDGLDVALKEQVVHGSDGSVGFHGWTPKTIVTACDFRNAPDGTLRCLPSPLSTGSRFFADDHCSSAIFNRPVSECGPGVALIGQSAAAEANACDPGTLGADFFLVGAEYTGPFFRIGSNGACETGAPSTGIRAGAKLDPRAVFSEAKSLHVPATERIEAVFAQLPSGARHRLGWFDSLKRIECRMTPAADGRWRCLPKDNSTVTIRDAFDSAACEGRKNVAYLATPGVAECRRDGAVSNCPAGCVRPPTPEFVVQSGYALCGGVTVVYSVGASTTAFLRSMMSGGGGQKCVALDRADEGVYEIAERSPTDFVEGAISFP